MKEIKFRAWIIDLKRMSYNIEDIGFVRFNSMSNKKGKLWFIKENYNSDSFVRKSECNNFELMQSTGLKDKNGKDIYEGDIVKPISITGSNMIVEFKEGMFNIASMMKFSYYFEVIGNKFENPELLEETKK